MRFTNLMGQRGESDLRLVDFTPRSMLRLPAHEVVRPRFPVIDFHNHLDEFEPADVLRVMDECAIERAVNITSLPGDRGVEAILRFHSAAPGRFHTCMWMDWRDIEHPDFFRRSVERLECFAAAGGSGVKFWKDCGLTVREANGQLLRIDDERLSPLFERAGDLGLFVMFHTADPEAFFLPVDRHNERFEELIAHPDWTFASSPVSHAELIAQRNRVIQRHPSTRFVCAHMAEQAENLAAVGELLDTCPNAWVDISARLNELGRQPFTARRFFERHADRILFGTDLPIEDSVYRSYFRLLETEDEYFDYPTHASRQGRWMVYGLNLSDSVLERVYRTNALALLTSR